MAISVTSPDEFRHLSKALRDGIIAYGFKPTEVLLLLILCRETFDRDLLEARANLPAWSKELGWRPDKFEKEIWDELLLTGVVDYNAPQGTYTLRPDLASWSRIRSLRVPNNLRAGLELPLAAERPLDESLSSLSREAALRQAPLREPGPQKPYPAGSQPSKSEWQRLRLAIDRNTVEQEFPATIPAEKSAASPENNSSVTAENSAAPQIAGFTGISATAEFSAASPIASLALSTKAKLAKAEKSAAAWRWLQEIDSHGHLGNAISERQWSGLCDAHPAYILDQLRPTLQHQSAKQRIDDPLAYLARKARDDGRLR